MLLFANAYLIAFLAAGVLSLTSLAFPDGTVPRHLLAGLSSLVHFPLVLGAPVLYLLLGLTPRLPKKAFLPLVLFVAWALLSGMPLPIYLELGTVSLVLALGQVLLGLVALFLIRRHAQGRSWLLIESAPPGPAFRLRNTVLFFGGSLVLVPLGLALYAFLNFSLAADHLTAGFVDLGLRGVQTQERVYTRGDKTVHLIGMMHVGQKGFYEDVISSFPRQDAIVLAEGVSDTEGVVKPGFTYEGLASALGLESQEEFPILGGTLAVENADVDVRDFSPATVELLNAAAKVLGSKSASEALRAYSQFAKARSREGVLETLREELIDMRNERLLGHLTGSLNRYDRVIVPWGAAHMGGIERGVLAQGFELSRVREWQVIGFF